MNDATPMYRVAVVFPNGNVIDIDKQTAHEAVDLSNQVTSRCAGAITYVICRRESSPLFGPDREDISES